MAKKAKDLLVKFQRNFRIEKLYDFRILIGAYLLNFDNFDNCRIPNFHQEPTQLRGQLQKFVQRTSMKYEICNNEINDVINNIENSN